MGSLQVLVVDDKPAERALAVTALAALGIDRVLEAGDGAGALDLIAMGAGPLDLVICDPQLGGMDGIDFLKHVADGRLAESVVLASSLADDVVQSVETMALQRGMRVLGRVDKPVRRDALAPLLDAHLSGLPRTTFTAPAVADQMPIAEIRRGLADGELRAWYQPKVAAQTGRLVGVEALARWHHPTKGVISPARFIDAMESHGLIADLSETMMAQSVALARRFVDMGRPISVAFNASASWLRDTTIPRRLRELTSRIGVAPELVTLEVTETAVAQDLADVLETLSRLRILGFSLSIDDFGTGYSSLQQLWRLPFTELKIDRSFVRKVDRMRRSRTIVRSMIGLAQDLGMKTVAEGVETDAEHALLAELGCDIEQGYRFSRPLKEQDLVTWSEAAGR